MPSGVYKHKKCTQEFKEMMRKKMKGRVISWGKKISEAKKGKPNEYQRGRKASDEERLKMSQNSSHYWLGKKKPSMSKEARMKIREANLGEKSHFWKGGATNKNKIIRMGIEFRLWRESVFARDNWTCQKYGCRGEKGFGSRVVLHPHHIQNFSEFPELRFAIDNGITLSEKAHKEFHHLYGIKNNTREQLEEFLK